MTSQPIPSVTPTGEENALPSDPVIEAYKRDVDRGLLRENLKLTVEQRLQNLQRFVDAIEELRRAVKAARK